MKQKQMACRIGIYGLGIILLTLGVSLCTKANVGISCVTSVPYSIAAAFGLNFPRTLLVVYLMMVAAQFLLKGKNRQLRDLFQIPFSMVFSTFMNWFETLIDIHYDSLWQNLLLLVGSVIIMGIGVSMTVNMNFVPNPPDGLTQTCSERFHISMGLTKNMTDALCVATAVIVDLRFGGGLHSVGIGTVISMICIGRVIAVFDHFCKKKMLQMAGLAKTAA